eukprot:15456067-Alexandrium_andersonii.AAC.1
MWSVRLPALTCPSPRGPRWRPTRSGQEAHLEAIRALAVSAPLAALACLRASEPYACVARAFATSAP